MKHRTVVALTSLTLGVLPATAALSNFDTSAEGWLIADLPGNRVYTPTLGTFSPVHRPAGYISHTDATNNSIFFSAPASYLGNQSSALGTDLSFDLRTTHDSWVIDTVAVLRGANGVILVAPFALPTINVWTSYSIPVVASSFRIDSPIGVVASESDLQGVLADLELLAINAEFGNGLIETTDLDNVRFGVIPEPAGLALLTPGLILLSRRRSY